MIASDDPSIPADDLSLSRLSPPLPPPQMMVAGRSLKKGGFDKDTVRPLQYMFALKSLVDATIMFTLPLVAAFTQDEATIKLTFQLCNFWRGLTLFFTGGQVYVMRSAILGALEGAKGDKVEAIKEYFNQLTK